MPALSRIPCPQCGTMNLAQDAQCLGCGIRFTARPQAAPTAPPEQSAPDEMCRRCYGVLLPAARFDTANLMGGIDSSNGPALGGRTGREIAGALWLLDTVSELLVGSIQAKLFDRRLRRTLQEAPHSLCCPSCRTIVRR